MKRICNVCKNEKVNLLAYWFGLRHCEKCDIMFKIIQFNNEKFIKIDYDGINSPKGSIHTYLNKKHI